MKNQNIQPVINSVKTCDFCQEFARMPSHFEQLYSKNFEDRTLFATNNFVVLPSIGQIIEGYSLIVSKEHYTSISSLPGKLLQEVNSLVKYMREVFSKTYETSGIFFEHGVPDESEGHGGCGIYHLHLHAVPVMPAVELLQSTEYDFKLLSSLNDLKRLYGEEKPYLLYINHDGDIFSAEAQSVPSQYFRKLLADTVGYKLWNWRSAHKERRLITMYSKLKSEFDNTRPTNLV